MIYDILPVNNYQGNGVTTTFDFDFYIDNSSQLKVTLIDENEIRHVLKDNLDYSINEFKNSNGSYISFPLEGSDFGVLAQNQKISLELVLPISQETQFNNSSLLNLKALEYSFDYLTRLIQILSRKVERCVSVQECSDETANDLMDKLNNYTQLALNASNEAINATNNIEDNVYFIKQLYEYFSCEYRTIYSVGFFFKILKIWKNCGKQ